ALIKAISFDSRANNVGPWPANRGCSTNSYSSINPSSAKSRNSAELPRGVSVKETPRSGKAQLIRSPRISADRQIMMDLDWYLMVGRTTWALYREELNRDPDPEGFANFIFQARENGWTVVEMRANIRESPEWHAIHEAPRPVRQASLRPMPPGTYDRVLPWTPPHTRDFLRGDAWGVTIPGLPFVAGVPGSGGSREHPERLLTGLDYKYDRQQWWPKMLRA